MELLHKFGRKRGTCPNCEYEARELINKEWVGDEKICHDFKCETCGCVYTEFYKVVYDFSETFVDISYVPAINKE